MTEQKPKTKPRTAAKRAPRRGLRGKAASEAKAQANPADAMTRSSPKSDPKPPTPKRAAKTNVKAPAKAKTARGRKSAADAARASRKARFAVGDVVRHRFYPFRGVVYDIDPVFANTEEWWLSIPEEIRPSKDQPFYHLLAENAETEYVAYVSEQNLLPDNTGKPLRHPKIREMFEVDDDGAYHAVFISRH